jgi:hypothetical protein
LSEADALVHGLTTNQIHADPVCKISFTNKGWKGRWRGGWFGSDPKKTKNSRVKNNGQKSQQMLVNQNYGWIYLNGPFLKDGDSLFRSGVMNPDRRFVHLVEKRDGVLAYSDVPVNRNHEWVYYNFPGDPSKLPIPSQRDLWVQQQGLQMLPPPPSYEQEVAAQGPALVGPSSLTGRTPLRGDAREFQFHPSGKSAQSIPICAQRRRG